LHHEKHDLPIVLSDEGMQIDSSDEQCANADSSRIETRLSGSNVTLFKLTHEAKQDLAILSIDEGTQSAIRAEQCSNTDSLRTEIVQGDSN
jgi:hypothetical protein